MVEKSHIGSRNGVGEKFNWYLRMVPLLLSCVLASAQPTLDPAVQMVAELLASPDRDTRGLALQQVREGLPGAPATGELVGLLEKLHVEAQVSLLEALADRGDPAARDGIRRALSSPAEVVRAAALDALGTLGEPGDVPVLARTAVAGSKAEREAARRSLGRLRGDRVTPAILELMREAAPSVRIELFQVLVARKATEASPMVLRQMADAESSVRLSALNAAQSLCGARDVPALIQFLAAAPGETERNGAEAALLAVCRRGGQECLDPVIKALPESQLGLRLVLVRALAVIGGPAALRSLSDSLSSSSPELRHEVLRMLSDWPDKAAVPGLLGAVRQSENPVHHVLALRGLVRLASYEEKRPADVKLLSELWTVAKTPEEKRLVLGAIGSTGTTEALALAARGLEEQELVAEATLACALVGEKLSKADVRHGEGTLRKALELVKDDAVRQRLRRVLALNGST